MMSASATVEIAVKLITNVSLPHENVISYSLLLFFLRLLVLVCVVHRKAQLPSYVPTIAETKNQAEQKLRFLFSLIKNVDILE